MIPSQAPAGARRGSAALYGDPGRPHRWLLWAFFGLLATFLIGVLLLAAWEGSAWGWHPGVLYAFGPVFPFTFFFLLLLVFVVFRMSWWGYRRPWGYGGNGGYGSHGARDILKERFARGEISTDQLRQMTRDLDDVDRR